MRTTGEDIECGFEKDYHDSIALHCIRHFIIFIINEAQASLYEISQEQSFLSLHLFSITNGYHKIVVHNL